MRTLATIAALVVLASPAFAQTGGMSKEDVAKLAKAGVSDDVILSKIEQEKATFKLSADDIALLKGDGVSDRVLQAMLGKAPPKPAPAQPAGSSGNLTVRNTSHRAIKVAVNEKDGIVDFSWSSGTDVSRGGQLEFKVAGAEYKITVEGAPSRHVAKLPATLLVRGAEMEYLDVMTLTIQDGAGSTVMILHSVGKQTAGQRRPDPEPAYAVRLYGPQFSYMPLVSHNVLLGAGIGAIIGHQSGHRTQGALVGAAAGLMFDIWMWRNW